MDPETFSRYGNFVSKSAASDIGSRKQLNALGISGFDKLMILFDEENNILEVSRLYKTYNLCHLAELPPIVL